jgi:hypothetical protein
VRAQPNTINKLCEPHERRDLRGPAVRGTPCGMSPRRRGCLGHFQARGNRCSGPCDKCIVYPSSSAELTSTRRIRWYSNPTTYRSWRWWWALIRTVLGPVSAIAVFTIVWISMRYVWSVPVWQGNSISLGRGLESVMMSGWGQRQRADLNTLHRIISGILDKKKRRRVGH